MNDLYIKILKSFGLTIDDKYHVLTPSGKPFKINNLPVVLATDDNLRNLSEVDQNGLVKQKYYVFNPLNEHAIKGTPEDIKKLLPIAVTYVIELFHTIGNVLLNIVYENKQDNVPIELSKFFMSISKLKGRRRKIVKEDTIKQFDKMLSKTMLNKIYSPAKYKLLNNVKVEGESYHKALSIKFPLYEKAEDFIISEIVKVSEHNMDIYKAIYEYVFDHELKNHIIDATNVDIAPSFVVFLRGHYKLISRLNEYLDMLSEVVEDIDNEKVKLYYNLDLLNHLDKYKSEYSLVNNDGVKDLNIEKAAINKALGVNQDNNINKVIDRVNNSVNKVEESMSDEDYTLQVLKGTLSGSNTGTNNPMLQQLGMVQQPVMQQPVINPYTGQPIMQQQMTMQPTMTQQPIIQQQIGMQPTMTQQPIMGQQYMQPTMMQPPMGVQSSVNQPMGMQPAMMQQHYQPQILEQGEDGVTAVTAKGEVIKRLF